jgi:hypothetical protein
MRPLKVLAFLLGPALVALFIAVMLMVAYPNALRLGAPMLCPDDKPDAFVVRYTVQTSDGTGTNFTLFCLSERGEPEEVGTWEPLFLLTGFVAAVVYGFAVVLWLLAVLRRRGRDPGPPDAADPSAYEAPTTGEDPFEAIRDQQGPIIS